jgi:hypothetical protein
MVISKFKGVGRLDTRLALIEPHMPEGAYLVHCYDDGKLAHVQVIEGHTLRYSEDLAENFCLGVFNPAPVDRSALPRIEF